MNIQNRICCQDPRQTLDIEHSNMLNMLPTSAYTLNIEHSQSNMLPRSAPNIGHWTFKYFEYAANIRLYIKHWTFKIEYAAKIRVKHWTLNIQKLNMLLTSNRKIGHWTFKIFEYAANIRLNIEHWTFANVQCSKFNILPTS